MENRFGATFAAAGIDGTSMKGDHLPHGTIKSNNIYNIKINTYPMGNDRVFLITGGKAHIGAAAMAYSTGNGVLADSLSVPEHREEKLALDLARWAASVLEQTVTVLIGIHVDNATKNDIDQIIAVVNHAMKQEFACIN